MNSEDTRIIELESKFIFMEKTMDDLNDVILDQGREIDSMQRRITELETRIAAKQEGDGAGEADPLEERPPHY
ncbi:MAG: SlyX protein [Planctomycetota bacterium]|jgi:SlyX protein